MNTSSTSGAINTVIKYRTPVKQEEVIGRVPVDVFNSCQQPMTESATTQWREIKAWNPVMRDGQPVMEDHEQRFEASSLGESAGATGLFAGGVAGGMIGLVIGCNTGAPVLGPVLGALGLGLAGAALFSCDPGEQWVDSKEHELVNTSMKGYHENITWTGEGFQHQFVPDLTKTELAKYSVPTEIMMDLHDGTGPLPAFLTRQ